MTEPAKPAPPGALQRLVASLLGLVQSHLGIFSIELEEARDRLIRLLVLVIVGAGAILLFLLTLALGLMLMIDPAYRLHAVLGLLALFLVLATACLGMARHGMKNGPVAFEMTIDELRRDKERLLP
jgi:uncharacterized membrane protein YqjE